MIELKYCICKKQPKDIDYQYIIGGKYVYEYISETTVYVYPTKFDIDGDHLMTKENFKEHFMDIVEYRNQKIDKLLG